MSNWIGFELKHVLELMLIYNKLQRIIKHFKRLITWKYLEKWSPSILMLRRKLTRKRERTGSWWSTNSKRKKRKPKSFRNNYNAFNKSVMQKWLRLNQKLGRWINSNRISISNYKTSHLKRGKKALRNPLNMKAGMKRNRELELPTSTYLLIKCKEKMKNRRCWTCRNIHLGILDIHRANSH